jgi:hypothetical protein
MVADFKLPAHTDVGSNPEQTSLREVALYAGGQGSTTTVAFVLDIHFFSSPVTK